MKTIVFLHIPKTAGQTVHSELTRVVGARKTSPIRVHTQSDDQFPKGFKLYSGHLDWDTLDDLIPAQDRFTFSVLRNPFERIASFYFYTRENAKNCTAKELEHPTRAGMKAALTMSTDDYFFGGTKQWQNFIQNFYNNFYCSYFATRRMKGLRQVQKLTKREMLDTAALGARSIDRVYSLSQLGDLERDIKEVTGKTVQLTGKRINEGPQPKGQERWPKLVDMLEEDKNVDRLTALGAFDRLLMKDLGLL